jgi:hypothetical protein
MFDINATQEPDGDILKQVQEHGETLSSLEQKLEEAQELAEGLKASIKNLVEKILPDLMNDAGIKELMLTDGSKIKNTEFVFARIKDAVTAFKWLEDNGEESIVDNTVTMNFKNGDAERAAEAMELLEKEGFSFANKKGIHWKRLESFVKEALDNPELKETFPREAFGVYEGEVVKYTKPTH